MKIENVRQVYKTVLHEIFWTVISSGVVTCGQIEVLTIVNKTANGVLHDVIHRTHSGTIYFQMSNTSTAHM